MLVGEGHKEHGTAVPRLVIAGASSGVGKTTLTAGLIAALRRRGMAVQPFKAGPDYIDPSYHTLAAGRPCRNLDTWMLPPAAVRASFLRACRGIDLAVIEGVMGLYDGFGYETEEGSTAHLAKLLDAPVVLMLDAARMARSAGAVALGYLRFDPNLSLAGFIANGVGSASHGQGVAASVERATGLPCFGWLPRLDDLRIPERHLGLVPTAESGRWEAFVDAAAEHVARYVDVGGLVAAARRAPALPCSDESPSRGRVASVSRVRVAVARDEAFSFYYQDNLDLLRSAGAEIVFFSPLRDGELPPGVCGLYIGGGFPEMYAAALAENEPLRVALRRAIESGLPTYAECGGLMYLTGSITDLSGMTHPMVGVLPGRSVMVERLTMGYRVVTTCAETILAPAGLVLRGHEFHYSDWVDRPADLPAAYAIAPRRGGPARPEGYARDNLLASYVHLHFGAAPQLAARFVRACRDWAARLGAGGRGE
ncbi:MAG: cobyrinate a,c-diamide synthase [Chloroflexi bacterium]|nr:cobyrinate a,c-diamide synthase [Chloroflexota bacterium]